MKSSVKDLKRSEKLLTVKVTRVEFDAFFERALKKVGEKIKVPGFREGRAPASVVLEKVGEEAVTSETLDIALADTYMLAVREHDLNPVAYPEIQVKKVVQARQGLPEEEIVLEYEATIAVVPDIRIKNLEGIKVTRPVADPVTDEECDKVILELRRQKAILKETGDDAVATLGQWVEIAYEGLLNGVPKPEMKAEKHPLVLGDGNLIPGFEENIVGLKKGESKTFDIRFPKEYGQPEFAGQPAQFTVKVNEIKELILPEFDTTLAADFGFKEPEAMRQAIKDNLATEKKQEAENKLQELVLNELEKRSSVELPEKLIEQEQNGMLDDLKKRVEGQGMQWEPYLASMHRSEDDLKKEMRTQAERNVKLGLTLGYIVKEKDIKVANERLTAATALEWLISQATGEPMRDLDAHAGHDHDHDHDDHDHEHHHHDH